MKKVLLVVFSLAFLLACDERRSQLDVGPLGSGDEKDKLPKPELLEVYQGELTFDIPGYGDMLEAGAFVVLFKSSEISCQPEIQEDPKCLYDEYSGDLITEGYRVNSFVTVYNGEYDVRAVLCPANITIAEKFSPSDVLNSSNIKVNNNSPNCHYSPYCTPECFAGGGVPK